MRTYHIFKTKKIKQTELNMKMLYGKLKSIYKSYNKNTINDFFVYFENINKTLLTNYIENKFCNRYHKKDNKFLFYNKKTNEKTIVEINYTNIIIKTNVNFPSILKVFYMYNSNLIVIDFNNTDYFWLTEFCKNKYLKKV